MATYPNQTATPAVEATPTGVAYERVTVTTPTGDSALLVVPSSKPAGSAVTLVIGAHGHDGSHNTFEVHSASLSLRDRMTDDGYVFISPNMHGNTWANQVALDDLKAAHDYAAGVWNVQHVLLFGGSMGGMAVTQAFARNAVPKVRAVAAVAPALNLEENYGKSAYKPSITSAYGIASDGSDYATKTAGFAPLLHPASQYAGGHFRFYHSSEDTAIPKASNSDAFVSNGLTAQMADFQLRTMTGAHLNAGNYDAVDTSTFYATALAAAPAPDEPPATTTPGDPVVVHAVRAWNGSGWEDATPKVWDGTVWTEPALTGYVAA